MNNNTPLFIDSITDLNIKITKLEKQLHYNIRKREAYVKHFNFAARQASK